MRWLQTCSHLRSRRLKNARAPANASSPPTRRRYRYFFIGNLLVRIHCIIVMIRWTGLAPWVSRRTPAKGFSRVGPLAHASTEGATSGPDLSFCRRERLVIYCQTTSVSAAHATHCATYCTPCRPLIRVFVGRIRTPPPTRALEASLASPAERGAIPMPFGSYIASTREAFNVSKLGYPSPSN